MKIFKAVAHNLDVPSDGHHIINHFTKEIDAFKACIDWVKSKQGTNVLEDVNGTFNRSQGVIGVNLDYTICKNKPAIYYKSYYGNYNCVVYVDYIYDIMGELEDSL